MDRGAWLAVVHRVTKSWIQLSYWTRTHTVNSIFIFLMSNMFSILSRAYWPSKYLWRNHYGFDFQIHWRFWLLLPPLRIWKSINTKYENGWLGDISLLLISHSGSSNEGSGMVTLHFMYKHDIWWSRNFVSYLVLKDAISNSFHVKLPK